MAPNFMKVKVFGHRRTFQAPTPLNTDPDYHGDVESGSFLNEQHQNGGGSDTEVKNHHQGDNPYLDEYRA